MTDDLLTEFRSDVSLPDGATARRIYARATSGRRRVPRRRLLLAAAATGLAVPAVVFGSELIHSAPSPRGGVAQHLQSKFVSDVATAAQQDPRPEFARASRATIVRTLARNGARFHYRIRRVDVLPGRDGAPLMVLRVPGSLAIFSRSVGTLYRILDPVSRTPIITDRSGSRIDHTKYEAFYLEAVDSHGVPFLVVWNVWRQPIGGGGQWARKEGLYPFSHG